MNYKFISFVIIVLLLWLSCTSLAQPQTQTYLPESTANIERIAGEIINDIRKQYVIGYEPAADDTRKDFHKVQVTITEDPNQEKRVAITRVGYQSRKK